MTDWLTAIRARLEQGPATTEELAEACGCEVLRLGPCLYEQLKAGAVDVIGVKPNAAGHLYGIWSLTR